MNVAALLQRRSSPEIGMALNFLGIKPVKPEPMRKKLNFLKEYCEKHGVWPNVAAGLEGSIKARGAIDALRKHVLTDEEKTEFENLEKKYMQKKAKTTKEKIAFLKEYCEKNGVWPLSDERLENSSKASRAAKVLGKTKLADEEKTEFKNLEKKYIRHPRTTTKEKLDFLKEYCEKHDAWPRNDRKIGLNIKAADAVKALRKSTLTDEQRQTYNFLVKKYSKNADLLPGVDDKKSERIL